MLKQEEINAVIILSTWCFWFASNEQLTPPPPPSPINDERNTVRIKHIFWRYNSLYSEVFIIGSAKN